jgi:hypothetical protein
VFVDGVINKKTSTLVRGAINRGTKNCSLAVSSVFQSVLSVQFFFVGNVDHVED